MGERIKPLHSKQISALRMESTSKDIEKLALHQKSLD